ncbi:homoserine/homoserine lactone efflux protein [Endozoicomonas sp. 8E]|uniref:homoserine/homoserine lactone efflux protein n=1 Tax=Endozoicomonas sp. 8E TaxID=3035692 RepID=UPI002938E65E|nr:homoserine/homoserine lactone efflux protein [Endozoicomonas sp. 8E]WOG27874.1 homoserine/homoserine lactone efflux protein [Endozoicomonas sp. 8E]
MELNTWLAFLAATIIISLTPGAGAVNTMANAIRSGLIRTLPSIMGLQVALIIFLVVVAAGLGAILAASETLFTLIKWTGALYLIFLGIMKWREAPNGFSVESQTRTNKKKSFASAILVNLTNPKAIVFQAAFLPQFIDPALTIWPQYLVMGITMVMVDSLVMLGYASFALKLMPFLKKYGKLQNRLFGSMFITCGGLLAASQR